MENDTTILNDNNEVIQYTYETLMALVDAIIPRTPELAKLYGEIMLYGALDFYTDEYMYMILNYYTIPMANTIAELLNMEAEKYILSEGSKEYSTNESEEPAFTRLSTEDRLRVLSQLEYIENDSSENSLLQEYPDITTITNSLNRFTMLGYYSEWYGYGSTRLENPNLRILEYDPLSWEQVGYPGPTYSYANYVNQYYSIRNDQSQNQ